MDSSTQTIIRDDFFTAAREWLTDSYHVEYRYVARQAGDHAEVIHALVMFYPWMTKEGDVADFDFHVNAGDYVVGQKVFSSMSLIESTRILEEALDGAINLPSWKAFLTAANGRYHFLRGEARNIWVNMIHLSASALGADQHQNPELAPEN
ncbi:hypothetical protein DWU98_19410 [Dyella monticola]|uniref:Uncharacterized protein n=1 Tax=Dyella monticola TaxID=1927958 RepID=A0A370WSW9_9GAMM|nr:hypothetical protein [Dyella monticola]RDS79171.1 hypothetical protein DWU98_19410 [Dyella monticola]